MPTFDKYYLNGGYHWAECKRWSMAYNPPLLARYSMITNRLRKRLPGLTLDVGAGDGCLSAMASKYCTHLYAMEDDFDGCNISRSMLSSYQNVDVVNGNAYSIPFKEKVFDSIIFADVIEHLANPGMALSEIARVLRPSGRAYITTPHWRPERVWDQRHVTEFTVKELSVLLHGYFEQVDFYFAWPVFFSNVYRSFWGWRLLKIVGWLGINPFKIESQSHDGMCQILAVASRPIQQDS